MKLSNTWFTLTLCALLLAFSPSFAQTWGDKLSDAAIERTTHQVSYIAGWVKLDYPGGDVPDSTGVCTDVVIRAYRNALSTDLQKLIHEDMVANFSAYPTIWGLTTTDRNIDHRRTQNMECFLTRKGAKLPNSDDPADYKAGDLVFYADIASGHVGIVTNKKAEDDTPMVVHNIGRGTQLENFLFESRITGHYRWNPE